MQKVILLLLGGALPAGLPPKGKVKFHDPHQPGHPARVQVTFAHQRAQGYCDGSPKTLFRGCEWKESDGRMVGRCSIDKQSQLINLKKANKAI